MEKHSDYIKHLFKTGKLAPKNPQKIVDTVGY